MITQDEWDRLSDGARIERLHALVKRLPEGFEPVGLRDFALGDASHRVPEVRRGEDRFVLVPGGERRIGFEVERGWQPDPAEKASWEDTADEYGIEEALSAHLARVLLRRRSVIVPPMLVEVRAREVGFRRVDPRDPSVAYVVREHGGGRGVHTIYQGHRHVRITGSPGGSPVVEVALEQTHAELVADLSREGFRPPTPDEWEYLCGAGTETLYRWGDHAPTDRYPTDVSPEEAAWRRQWVLSGGTLEYPAQGFEWGFDLHRRPNALGLEIGFDPYRLELTTDARAPRWGRRRRDLRRLRLLRRLAHPGHRLLRARGLRRPARGARRAGLHVRAALLAARPVIADMRTTRPGVLASALARSAAGPPATRGAVAHATRGCPCDASMCPLRSSQQREPVRSYRSRWEAR